MKVIKAPQRMNLPAEEGPSIFLAGSIEMDTAERWQERAEKMFENTNFVVLNPRRDEWDSSWEQNYDNPQFRQQVEWELRGLENSNYKIFYFSPGTMSPITLLELGRAASEWNTAVVCPEGYQRKGNVDIFCEVNKIPQFNTLEEAVQFIKDKEKQ
jgi:hypothetical protein